MHCPLLLPAGPDAPGGGHLAGVYQLDGDTGPFIATVCGSMAMASMSK